MKEYGFVSRNSNLVYFHKMSKSKGIGNMFKNNDIVFFEINDESWEFKVFDYYNKRLYRLKESQNPTSYTDCGINRNGVIMYIFNETHNDFLI